MKIFIHHIYYVILDMDNCIYTRLNTTYKTLSFWFYPWGGTCRSRSTCQI